MQALVNGTGPQKGVKRKADDAAEENNLQNKKFNNSFNNNSFNNDNKQVKIP